MLSRYPGVPPSTWARRHKSLRIGQRLSGSEWTLFRLPRTPLQAGTCKWGGSPRGPVKRIVCRLNLCLMACPADNTSLRVQETL